MKALIIGSDPTGHEVSVQTAFVAGGGVTSDIYESGLDQTLIDYATTNEYDAIIYSYSGEESYFTLANSNPDVMIFMPSDEYSGDLQQLVLTDLSPSTDDYEFLDNTQSTVSESNGYICGQLFSIASQRDCSLQEARIVASLTATNKIIDVDSAVAYTGLTQLTVGSITAERTSGMLVSVTLERVIDATGYKIYRDGVLISTQTGLTYTDTLTTYGKFRYTYYAYNDNLSSIVSDPVTVKRNKIDYLVVR